MNFRGQPDTLDELNAQTYLANLLAFMDLDLARTFGSGEKVILSVASESVGKFVLNLYAQAWNISKWTPDLLGKAMVDLKNRTGGCAELVNASEDEIALNVTRCEFGNDLIRELRGSLCQVCASVFGAMAKSSGIAAALELPTWESSIAGGSEQCLVVTRLTTG
jgi:hypothetical protein